jgi:hypothetical protein
VDACPIGEDQWIGNDEKCFRSAVESLECGRDILGSSDFEFRGLQAQRGGDRLHLGHFEHSAGTADMSHDRQAAETGYNLA